MKNDASRETQKAQGDQMAKTYRALGVSAPGTVARSKESDKPLGQQMEPISSTALYVPFISISLSFVFPRWLNDKRAAVALIPPSIFFSFLDVRLTLKLPNCTGDRNARLHRLQLIPPLQPTVGIAGNLQEIVHLHSPELERWEGVQSENALQPLEADGQWQPLLM